MFCPTGATTGTTLNDNEFTISLISPDPDSRAVRVAVKTGTAYINFFGVATAADIQVTGPTAELFRVPKGSTDISIYATGALVSVTIGQDD